MTCPKCNRELNIYPLKKYFGAKPARLAMSKMGGSLAECQHCMRYFIIRNARIDLELTDVIKENSNG